MFPDGDSGLRGRREVFSPHVSSPLDRVAGGRLKLLKSVWSSICSGRRWDGGSLHPFLATLVRKGMIGLFSFGSYLDEQNVMFFNCVRGPIAVLLELSRRTEYNVL